MNRPPVPPDAAVIRLAREGARISVRHAAELARISKARWVQIENGYETRQGQVRPARAKPVTIAHMAYAVGLSPERLESEGQRPDAAEILREILHREVEAADVPAVIPAGSLPSAPMDDAAREIAVRPYAVPIWERLDRLRAQGVTDPSGIELGLAPDDAKIWDGSAGAMSQADRAWLVGDIQCRRNARDAQNRQDKTG